MDETTQDQRTEEAPRGAPDGGRPGGALAFARRHPALTVIGAAGAGLLGGLELVAGVLIGAGISAYVRGRDRREGAAGAHAARERAARIMDRIPPEMKKRARAVVQAARGELEPAPGTDQATPAR